MLDFLILTEKNENNKSFSEQYINTSCVLKLRFEAENKISFTDSIRIITKRK